MNWKEYFGFTKKSVMTLIVLFVLGILPSFLPCLSIPEATAPVYCYYASILYILFYIAIIYFIICFVSWFYYKMKKK